MSKDLQYAKCCKIYIKHMGVGKELQFPWGLYNNKLTL